jgi:hypothetical protein
MVDKSLEPLIAEFTKRGVEVKFLPLSLSFAGICCWCGKWYCCVNDADPPEVQQMSLAHELFHFDHSQNRIPNDAEDEAEAEEFAKSYSASKRDG